MDERNDLSWIESSLKLKVPRRTQTRGAERPAMALYAIPRGARLDDGIFGVTVILTFTAAGTGEHYR